MKRIIYILLAIVPVMMFSFSCNAEPVKKYKEMNVYLFIPEDSIVYTDSVDNKIVYTVVKPVTTDIYAFTYQMQLGRHWLTVHTKSGDLSLGIRLRQNGPDTFGIMKEGTEKYYKEVEIPGNIYICGKNGTNSILTPKSTTADKADPNQPTD